MCMAFVKKEKEGETNHDLRTKIPPPLAYSFITTFFFFFFFYQFPCPPFLLLFLLFSHLDWSTEQYVNEASEL